jgi:hypothetical protein
MPVTESTLPALLRARAELQPNSTSSTFIEQAHDPAGFAENLTRSQVYRRAQVVADELRLCAAAGEGATILIPQGLDYNVAFLGALLADLINRCSAVCPAIRYSRRASFRAVRHRSRFSVFGLLARFRFGGRPTFGTGVPAVHVWVDAHPDRRHCLAQECRLQCRAGNGGLLRGPRQDPIRSGGFVVAVLARHVADCRNLRSHDRWAQRSVAEPNVVSATAACWMPLLAAAYPTLSAAPNSQRGSIPITTVSKVRRSACVQRYLRDESARLDVTT